MTVKSTRIPGIKIHDMRMVRLMEALLHAGVGVAGEEHSCEGGKDV